MRRPSGPVGGIDGRAATSDRARGEVSATQASEAQTDMDRSGRSSTMRIGIPAESAASGDQNEGRASSTPPRKTQTDWGRPARDAPRNLGGQVDHLRGLERRNAPCDPVAELIEQGCWPPLGTATADDPVTVLQAMNEPWPLLAVSVVLNGTTHFLTSTRAGLVGSARSAANSARSDGLPGVGLGDPGRQPPAKAVPVGVLPTEAQTPSRVNEVDEAVTRDSRRPGQRERASAVPVGSTSSGWTGGDTSGTLSQGAPTDRPRPDRLLPRGEEPAERLPLAG
jgi:hypothetical protein